VVAVEMGVELEEKVPQSKAGHTNAERKSKRKKYPNPRLRGRLRG